jgi:hypothetical protein
VFGECGGVHVGIETDGDAETPVNRPDKIEIAPLAFGRGSDEPVVCRGRVELNRTERRDADRLRRLARAEKRAGLLDGLFRPAGLKAPFGDDLAPGVSKRTDELGPACFDSSQHRLPHG